MANLSNINNKFLVTTGGNVGINVTGPSTRLTVDVPAILNNTVNIFQLGDDTNGLVFKKFWNASGIAWRLNKGVSGVNMMTFSQDGKVGIGTDSPDEKLDITGGFLKFNGGDYGLKGSASLTYNPAEDHYFQSSGSTKVTFKASGNVGIGTATPDYTLHLLKSSGDTEMYINGQNGQSSLRMGLDARNWQIKTAAAPYLWSLNYVGTDFQTPNIITATVGGNVGIGTDSPQSRLALNTNATSPGSMLEINNRGDLTPGSWSAIRFGLDSNTYPGQYGKGGIIYESRDGYNRGKLHLAVDMTADNGSIVLADSILTADGTTGNVGIGTTSPGAKLEIKATGASSGLTFRTTDSSNNETFYIKDGGTVGVRYYPFKIGVASGTTNVANSRFQIATTGGDFVVLNDGKTGIGIATPSKLLHLLGADATVQIQGSGTSSNAGVDFFPRDSSNVAHLQSIKGVGSNLTFLTGGNSGNSYVPTERMRIDSSGDVTIQTSGADDIKNLTINSSNGSSQVAGFVIQNDGANGYIYFKAGAGGGTPTTKLTIGNAANSGNVGIGTTSPDYKLDVSGSIRAGRYTTNVYYYSTTNSVSNQYFHIKTSVNANSQTCMHTWSVEGYAYGSGAIIDCKLAFHTDSGGNIYGKSYLGSLANNIYKSTDNYVVLVFGTVNTYYTHFYTNLFEGMYTTLNSTVLAVAYSPNNSGVY